MENAKISTQTPQGATLNFQANGTAYSECPNTHRFYPKRLEILKTR